MTDLEFDEFVARCQAELRQKQEWLRDEFALGTWAAWNYNQATGSLTFRDATGEVTVEAEVTFIGSFSSDAGTWIWGWANASLLPAVRQQSAALQGLAEVTGVRTFREKGGMRVDEARPRELAAMAVHYLGALGCYSGPSGPSHVFLSVDYIRRV